MSDVVAEETPVHYKRSIQYPMTACGLPRGFYWRFSPLVANVDCTDCEATEEYAVAAAAQAV